MLILPAIDIYEGKCVRLRKGDFETRKEYSASVYDQAKAYVDAGLPNIHVVDLEGAKEGRVKNWTAIRTILSVPGVRAQIGGGVRTGSQIELLLELGAQRVVIGTIAVVVPSLVKKWLDEYGPDRLSVAVDVKNGKIVHSGWQEQVEEVPTMFAIKMRHFGVSNLICTDVSRDGLLQGPNIELYKTMRSVPDIALIASGGISSIEDVQALDSARVDGAIIGKALYEGKIMLSELTQYAH